MTKMPTEPATESKQAPTSPARHDVADNKPSQPQKSSHKPKQGIPKPVRILGVLGLTVGVGFGVYRQFIYQPQPEGLFLSGRIEGYETDISKKTESPKCLG